MVIKPDYCSWCGSENLIFVKDNIVFNPDLDIDEKMDSYVCLDCKTIHVNNNEYSFIQRDIDSNKLIQTTNTNITIN